MQKCLHARISTPVDISILQVLFDHFEEQVGPGTNHITHIWFLFGTSTVMPPGSIFKKGTSQNEPEVGIYKMENMNYRSTD